MAKVLVTEKLSEEGIRILSSSADVDVKLGLQKEELIGCIGEYDGLVVRSATKVTEDVLSAASKLKIIGRAGVGVDNIDVANATQRGIIVVNSPEGNTIAAAELTLAHLLSLSRNIPAADASVKAGEWERGKFTGVEVYNKTLGIIGLGKIGREVAKRALGFEMRILGFDPFLAADAAKKLGIELVDLDELLKRSDYVTVHVPKNKETEGMIGTEQFEAMKDGVRVINVARGGIINESALSEALASGKVAGAAVDVYSQEPVVPENPVLKAPRIVTTPHLGASTEEAQSKVAVDVAEQIVDYFNGKPARSAVNMPAISSEVQKRVAPFLTLGQRMGSFITQTTDGRIDGVDISFCGGVASEEIGAVTRAALVGILAPMMSETVNFVNAPVIAETRGIRVTESRCPSAGDYTSLLSLEVSTDRGKRSVKGTIFGKSDGRIVGVDGYFVDLVPEGTLLVAPHTDRPGMIGKVGTILGNSDINIGLMHVGRKTAGSRALMLLAVDSAIPDETIAEIAKVDGIDSARQVIFR